MSRKKETKIQKETVQITVYSSNKELWDLLHQKGARKAPIIRELALKGLALSHQESNETQEKSENIESLSSSALISAIREKTVAIREMTKAIKQISVTSNASSKTMNEEPEQEKENEFTIDYKIDTNSIFGL